MAEPIHRAWGDAAWRLVWSRLTWAMLTWAMLVGVPSASAATPSDLDEHVNRLTSQLRCLVCQNQTIADSQAALAVQLKNEVRQQLAHGATDAQVRDFMVQRYGDFVLYRPPWQGTTWLLWSGPAWLLALGATLAVLHWRARRAASHLGPDSIVFEEEAQETAT